MEKVRNEIKIPAIIALAVQGVIVCMELLVTALQDKFFPIFIGNPGITDGAKVFPPAIIFSVLELGIYIAFVSVIFYYTGDRRRPVSIALMAVNLALAGLSYPINIIYTQLIARVKGTAYIAAYSGVSSMLGICRSAYVFHSMRKIRHKQKRRSVKIMPVKRKVKATSSF